MSINGIGIGNSGNTSASPYGVDNVTSTNSGNATSGSTNALTGNGQGGQLTAALLQALAQLGVNPTTSGESTGLGASSSSSDAVNNLIQSLAAALQSQNSGNANNPAATTAGNALAGATGQGSLQSALQNLILQIGTENSKTLGSMFDNASSGDSPAGSFFDQSDSGNASPLTSLQQSFNNLVGGQSTSGSQGAGGLQNLLQSMLQQIQSSGASGNLISTAA